MHTGLVQGRILPLLHEMKCLQVVVARRDVFATTMMCNWDIAMENTMDPSHANWLHDGFAGKWEDAAVMTMRLAENQTDPKQVQAFTPFPCLGSLL